jgi:Xaa-Pro aminopeptidase
MDVTRVSALRCSIAANDCQAAVILSKSDFQYLAGAWLDGLVLVVGSRFRAILASQMLATHVKRMFPGWLVITDKEWFTGLERLLRKKRISRVLLDSTATTVDQAEKLRKIKGIRWQFKPRIAAQQRRIKSPAEIKAIRKAGHLTRRIVALVQRQIRPGMREIDVARQIDELFLKAGARPAFETIVSFGSAASEPHHTPSRRKLPKNCVILIDAGCCLGGYASDLTKTFYLGKITQLYSRIYTLVLRAKDAAQALVREGARAAAIDDACRRIFSSEGMERYFTHSTGHGVGIDVHEAPRIGKNSADVLKAGMVITIEPGIYIPGKIGVRIEDTLLVTKKGYEILTK